MKLEIDLALEYVNRDGVQPAQTVGESTLLNGGEIAALRGINRSATDGLINNALMKDDWIALAAALPNVALGTAEIAVRSGHLPTIADFIHGARELIEDGRLIVDRGLQVQEWDQVRVGSTMLEIVWRGICACLDVPYADLVQERHRAMMAGETDDRKAYALILARAGINVPVDPPPPASNDEAGASIPGVSEGNRNAVGSDPQTANDDDGDHGIARGD